MDPDRSLRHRAKMQVVLSEDRLGPQVKSTDYDRAAATAVGASCSAVCNGLSAGCAGRGFPGHVALNSWDLTPPGPLWGVRGLVVLEGHVFDQIPAADEIKPLPESVAFQAVAFQPPFTPGWRHWALAEYRS